MNTDAVLDYLAEFGWHHLIGDDATKDNVTLLRRAAKARGIRFRSSTGRTMHGTRVITLELVES